MTIRTPEAERLATCHRVFKRALADGVSMDEARRRERADRWREADARLAAKRCGTAAPSISAEPTDADDGDHLLKWFQR